MKLKRNVDIHKYHHQLSKWKSLQDDILEWDVSEHANHFGILSVIGRTYLSSTHNCVQSFLFRHFKISPLLWLDYCENIDYTLMLTFICSKNWKFDNRKMIAKDINWITNLFQTYFGGWCGLYILYAFKSSFNIWLPLL